MTELASLEEKAVELIEKFETIAETHGSEAVDLGLDAVRVIGLQDIATSMLFLIGSLICAFIARYIWKVIKNWDPEEHNGKGYDHDFWPIGPFSIASGATIIFFVFAVLGLINIWIWVAVFYPEVWLAGKLFR